MPPAHYTLKIESFSRFCELLEKTGLVKYESDAFASVGYNWKLVLYPSGNVKRDGSDHISLYLAIAEPNAIPPGSQVDVILKFFVFDHLRDEYLTIQGSRIYYSTYDNMRRYHSLKTENGFDQLISLKMFNDSSNGYLFDDCCSLGAEVHVIKYEASLSNAEKQVCDYQSKLENLNENFCKVGGYMKMII
ncbi:MATH domain and coiled-coil domain-containing protein At3g58250 [Manihot esculenta]|uniref:MATH domain and coiled-coil domain-containing protein At3g58250 n=1 Tax=Manihot esculenta TaxID=3983 RepID=UPI000B5D926E|nr:MATH domain and coiled-coil domain-containing protein At3g58250 [Manihot esculenta]